MDRGPSSGCLERVCVVRFGIALFASIMHRLMEQLVEKKNSLFCNSFFSFRDFAVLVHDAVKWRKCFMTFF